ncbi:MAG: RnfABCDGE type electron transport complex subunit D [Mucinivorans sp.]
MKIVSPSPHLHTGENTSSLMRDVLIALSPALAFSIWIYGMSALCTSAVAVLSCIIFEWAITRFLLKRPSSISDSSAALTGLLLAFNLPAEISPWLVVLGALISIGVAKMSFGGLGRNIFNPALVGRVFLLVSFPVQMTTYTVNGVSGATPLAMAKGATFSGAMPTFDMGNMMLGVDKGGSMGEIAGILLLLGGVYLLVRRVISWHIPVMVLGTMALFSAILWGVDPSRYASPLFQIFAGGAILGAIYMATDYVTSPMSHSGMIVYGVGIGLLTILIRTWGAYPEGVSFAILIMNATVPLINMYMKPKRFGAKK